MVQWKSLQDQPVFVITEAMLSMGEKTFSLKNGAAVAIAETLSQLGIKF